MVVSGVCFVVIDKSVEQCTVGVVRRRSCKLVTSLQLQLQLQAMHLKQFVPRMPSKTSALLHARACLNVCLHEPQWTVCLEGYSHEMEGTSESMCAFCLQPCRCGCLEVPVHI